MSPSYATKGVFFVNKGQNSTILTRGEEGHEKFQILSHVRRKKTVHRPDISKVPWMKYTTILSPLESHISVEAEGQNAAKVRPSRPELAIWLPKMHPSGNAIDPFHATVAGSGFSPHALLQAVFIRTAKSAFFTEAYGPSALARPSRHDKIMQSRLKECVSNDMLLYSSLAYASSLAAWSKGEDYGRKHEEFNYKATRAIIERLAAVDCHLDTWLQLSIYSLAVTAFWNASPVMWRSNPERLKLAVKNRSEWLHGYKVHMNALLGIVKKRGGIEYTEPYVVDSMILAEKYITLQTMSTPMLEMTWDPGSYFFTGFESVPEDLSGLQESWKNVIEISIDTYTRRIFEKPVHPTLAQIILDIVECWVVAQWEWNKLDSDFQAEAWLFRRLQALTFRLMYFPPDTVRDRCLKLAVLISLLASTEHAGAQIGVAGLAEDLGGILLQVDYENSELDNCFLLWCLCIGAMTPYPCGIKTWFIEKISSYDLGSPTFDALVDRLDGFLIFLERQEDALRDLAHTLDKLQNSTGRSSLSNFMKSI